MRTSWRLASSSYIIDEAIYVAPSCCFISIWDWFLTHSLVEVFRFVLSSRADIGKGVHLVLMTSYRSDVWLTGNVIGCHGQWWRPAPLSTAAGREILLCPFNASDLTVLIGLKRRSCCYAWISCVGWHVLLLPNCSARMSRNLFQ